MTEFLLLTKEGQAYIKDINFDKLPAGEYNITVLINVYLYNIYLLLQSIVNANYLIDVKRISNNYRIKHFRRKMINYKIHLQ